MIALIQRVSRASVDISEKEVAAIGAGLMVLLGIQVDDTDKEARKYQQESYIHGNYDIKMNRLKKRKWSPLSYISKSSIRCIQ